MSRWAIGRFPFEEPILDTCAGWEPNYYQPLFPGKTVYQAGYAGLRSTLY